MLGEPPLTKSVRIERDVPYGDGANRRQELDIYLPEQRDDDSLPVIVYFHSGGWRQGDKSEGARRLVPFVRTGRYAGVSAGYRFSEEAIWPAQIHDAKAAIRWIRANAARYGLNPEKICAWGASAGAHIALMIGMTRGVPGLEGEVGPHGNVSSEVICIVNYSGVTDMLAMLDQPRTSSDTPMDLLLGGPVREKAKLAASASPVTHATKDDPPVLTVHGNLDTTVPYQQAVSLDRALRKAGVASFLIIAKGAGHAIHSRLSDIDERTEAFFARYLLGQDTQISSEPIRPRRRNDDASRPRRE